MSYIKEALDKIEEVEDNNNMKDVEAPSENENTQDNETTTITPEQKRIAKEITDFFQSLIDEEAKGNGELEEDFTSFDSLKKHFYKHCLARDPRHKSTRNTVYYDFTFWRDYGNYERKVSNDLNNARSSKNIIVCEDPFNKKDLNEKFIKLFEDNKFLTFSPSWKFQNETGPVHLYVHSYCSDVTTNYSHENTLDIILKDPSSGKTISLYPVAESRVKIKLINIFKKRGGYQFNISQNPKKLVDNLQKNNLNKQLTEDIENEENYLDKLGIKSNGIYSINTGWLKHPTQEDIPDIDEDEFEKEFKIWEDKYFNLLELLDGKTILNEDNDLSSSIVDQIDNLIEDIYNLRQEGLQEPEGEYSIKNLIFKEFRNLGYLDNLKELKKQEISKELSLESIVK